MSVAGDPWTSNQYSRPGGQGQPSAPPRNGFGIAALGLGLLALALSWTIIGGIIFGVPALIFGLLGRARVKRGESTNGGVATAGVVLGTIGLLIVIGLVVLVVTVLNSAAGQTYRQCVQQSGGNPASIQRCVSEFGHQLRGG